MFYIHSIYQGGRRLASHTMKYKVEKVPNYPVTIWTPYKDWNWDTDMPAANAELEAIWDAADEKMIHIANLEDFYIDFDGIVKGTANVGFGANALYNHPNLKEAIIVSSQEGMTFVVEQVNAATETYQSVPIKTFDTLKNALAYIRAQD